MRCEVRGNPQDAFGHSRPVAPIHREAPLRRGGCESGLAYLYVFSIEILCLYAHLRLIRHNQNDVISVSGFGLDTETQCLLVFVLIQCFDALCVSLFPNALLINLVVVSVIFECRC